MTNVFVYGTLKRKHYNHDLLRGETTQYLGISITEPKFDLVSLGAFPGAIRGNYRIEGELYKIDDNTLDLLDHLERNGSLYQREEIQIENFPEPVWMYIFLHKVNEQNQNHIEIRDDIKIWRR